MNEIQYQEIVLKQSEEYIKNLSLWYSKFHWDWYCHFTFRCDIPDWKKKWIEGKAIQSVSKINGEYAVKIFKRWRRVICEEIFGEKFREKGLGLNYVIGIEEENTYHTHIHAVIGNSFGLDLNQWVCRMCLKNLWEKTGLRTGMMRIENFDYKRFKETQSIFYLCKHQIKQNNIRDFFVFGKWKMSEINGWLKYNKRYVSIQEYLNWIEKNKGKLEIGLKLALSGWTLDFVSQVWCKGICKLYTKISEKSNIENKGAKGYAGDMPDTLNGSGDLFGENTSSPRAPLK